MDIQIDAGLAKRMLQSVQSSPFAQPLYSTAATGVVEKKSLGGSIHTLQIDYSGVVYILRLQV